MSTNTTSNHTHQSLLAPQAMERLFYTTSAPNHPLVMLGEGSKIAPPSINGAYLLLGPYNIDPRLVENYANWPGWLHRVSFENGKVGYRATCVTEQPKNDNSFYIDRMFKESLLSLVSSQVIANPRLFYAALRQGYLANALGLRIPRNINAEQVGSYVLAMADGSVPAVFNRELSIVPEEEIPSALKVPMMAHPIIDTAKGEWYRVRIDAAGRNWLERLGFDFKVRQTKLVSARIRDVFNLHDMRKAADYVVFGHSGLRVAPHKATRLCLSPRLLILDVNKDQTQTIDIPISGYVAQHVFSVEEDEPDQLRISCLLANAAALQVVYNCRKEYAHLLASDGPQIRPAYVTARRIRGRWHVTDHRVFEFNSFFPRAFNAGGRHLLACSVADYEQQRLLLRTVSREGEILGEYKFDGWSYLQEPGIIEDGERTWLVSIESRPYEPNAPSSLLLFDILDVEAGPVLREALPTYVPAQVHSSWGPA